MRRNRRRWLTRIAQTLALWMVGSGIAASLIADALAPKPKLDTKA